MHKLSMLAQAAATVAIASLALAAAGGGPGTQAPPSAAPFVSLATTGVHADFTPLASPRDAVDKADLIIEGTLRDVVDGIVLQFPNPLYTKHEAGAYATLVIDVNKVLDGDPGRVSGGRVYVALAKSPVITAAQLAAANPRPNIVAVLEDITTWSPAPDVMVRRPAAVPPDAPLYAPYTDGLWLQASGDTQMFGLGAHREELGPAWGAPHHLRHISAALELAAAQ